MNKMTPSEKEALYLVIKQTLKNYMFVSLVSFFMLLAFLILNFFMKFSNGATLIITFVMIVALIYVFIMKAKVIKNINILIENTDNKYGKKRAIFKKAIPLLSQQDLRYLEFIKQMKK